METTEDMSKKRETGDLPNGIWINPYNGERYVVMSSGSFTRASRLVKSRFPYYRTGNTNKLLVQGDMGLLW